MGDLSRLLILSLLCSFTLFSAPIDYIRIESKTPSRMIHHFKVNPQQVVIQLVNGSDCCVGLETVSSIAKRKGAVLAINGGYFQGGPLLGAPDGPFKINGLISGSSYSLSGALGWKENGSVSVIDRIFIHSHLSCGGKSFPITAINRNIHFDSAILYTSNFNKTTMTPAGTLEAEISGTQFSRILARSGSSIIPNIGGIYSVGKKYEGFIQTSILRKAAQVKHLIKPSLHPAKMGQWNMTDHIVNGVLILSGKKIISDYNKESVPELIYKPKHARTAVGIDDAQIWHIVIVEANHQGREGMDLNELSHLMLKMGCHSAIALDGGGSSTLYYDGKATQLTAHKNHPYMQNNVYYHPNGGERPIGNAIIIKKR